VTHVTAGPRPATPEIIHDAAEGVVADTFLAAFGQRKRYDLSWSNARPWLYGIATNLIGRHKRIEVRQTRGRFAPSSRSPWLR
jgi:RNA polymerase sigma-70 factor (ECF subfamily)